MTNQEKEYWKVCPFKLGDILETIEDSGFLKKGDLVTVLDRAKDKGCRWDVYLSNKYVFVENHRNMKQGGFYWERFKLYKPKEPISQSISFSTKLSSITVCPLCGNNSLNLGVTIYCENVKCKNYHP